VLDSNAISYFERRTLYLGDSEVKLIKSKDIFLTAQPGGKPIKKRKDVSRERWYGTGDPEAPEHLLQHSVCDPITEKL